MNNKLSGGYTMLKKIIPTIMVALFAVSAFAAAPAFGDLDADHNGMLSKGEAEAAGIGPELFAKADADANGSLSQEEYATLTTGEKK